MAKKEGQLNVRFSKKKPTKSIQESRGISIAFAKKTHLAKKGDKKDEDALGEFAKALKKGTPRKKAQDETKIWAKHDYHAWSQAIQLESPEF